MMVLIFIQVETILVILINSFKFVEINEKGLITALSISILNFNPSLRGKAGIGTLLVAIFNQSEKLTPSIKIILEKFADEMNLLRKGFYFKNKEGNKFLV